MGSFTGPPSCGGAGTAVLRSPVSGPQPLAQKELSCLQCGARKDWEAAGDVDAVAVDTEREREGGGAGAERLAIYSSLSQPPSSSDCSPAPVPPVSSTFWWAQAPSPQGAEIWKWGC